MTWFGIGDLSVSSVVLWAVVAGLLLLMVARSLRKAFRRPGATAEALRQYSLSTGRTMLLAGWLAYALPSPLVSDDLDSPVLRAGAAGILALVVARFAESRWPRQTGSVRVAPLVRRTFQGTVRTRYSVVLGAAAVIAVLALSVRLALDAPVVAPAAGEPGFGSALSVGIATSPGYGQYQVAQRFQGELPDLQYSWIGAGLLVVAGLLTALVIRKVLHRPALAGIGADGDQVLRRVAAERAIRGLSAVSLVFSIGVLTELNAALRDLRMDVVGVTQGLATFLQWSQLVLGLAVVGLYLVGPNGPRIRKAVAGGEPAVPASTTR